MARDDGDRAKIRAMVDYARDHEVPEVPDPYYGGAKGFQRVLDLLEDACAGLLDDLRGDNKGTRHG
jgi:protein-tyrosine phosphatase